MAYNSDEMEPMLTTSEVAKILNVHINTIRRWSNSGTLKSYRIGSRGDRRFRGSDVNLMLDKSVSSEKQV
jgi:excisionase family DNA binding protein